MRWAAIRHKLLPQERSEEHTSELQSQSNLVCRLLLEKKKKLYSKNAWLFNNCERCTSRLETTADNIVTRRTTDYMLLTYKLLHLHCTRLLRCNPLMTC